MIKHYVEWLVASEYSPCINEVQERDVKPTKAPKMSFYGYRLFGLYPKDTVISNFWESEQ